VKIRAKLDEQLGTRIFPYLEPEHPSSNTAIPFTDCIIAVREELNNKLINFYYVTACRALVLSLFDIFFAA
jgi:hypothetical protein